MTRQSGNSSSPNLLTLPLELHLLIATYLPFPAYLSLRLTHPYLYHALAAPRNPSPLRDLDQCARVAVRTYLAPYLSAQPTRPETKEHDEPGITNPRAKGKGDDDEQQTQRCALCGNTYPLRLFKSSSSPACSTRDLGPVRRPLRTHVMELDQEAAEQVGERNDALATKRRGGPGWDVVELPQRVCCWHVGRLTRVVTVNDDNGPTEEGVGTNQGSAEGIISGDNVVGERQSTSSAEVGRGGGQLLTWVSRMEQMCTHCGSIQAWRQCQCRCQSCSLRPARTYTRYAEQGWSCSGYVFWRDSEGKLWVRENVSVPSFGERHRTTSFVDKPVTFE